MRHTPAGSFQQLSWCDVLQFPYSRETFIDKDYLKVQLQIDNLQDYFAAFSQGARGIFGWLLISNTTSLVHKKSKEKTNKKIFRSKYSIKQALNETVRPYRFIDEYYYSEGKLILMKDCFCSMFVKHIHLR